MFEVRTLVLVSSYLEAGLSDYCKINVDDYPSRYNMRIYIREMVVGGPWVSELHLNFWVTLTPTPQPSLGEM